MSQQDGFAGGFLLGSLVGGVLGGVVGALIATKQLENASETEEPKLGATPLERKTTQRKGLFKPASAQTDMEAARRSLEDKIAQLNDAIDDVRQQLGGVNGGLVSDVEQVVVKKNHGQG
jgi:gas vesicle protein